MKKNKLGFILLGFYLLVTIAIVLYTQVCSEMFCGAVMVVPIMPWPFILEGIVQDSLPIFVCLIALNALIIYFIGSAISKLFNKDVS